MSLRLCVFVLVRRGSLASSCVCAGMEEDSAACVYIIYM